MSEPETNDPFAALGIGFDEGAAILGADLLTRAQETSDRQTLDEAIDVLSLAVRSTPPDSGVRHERLSNLGLAHRLRSERHGTEEDLELAIEIGRLAVTTGGGNDVGCLANLADSLHSRFERAGDRQDLEIAVALYQGAADAVDDDHPLLAVVVGKLGIALAGRFVLSGDQDDIDQAVELSRLAAAGIAVDDPFYAQTQTNLGSALALRASLTGTPADLDDAIAACRNAVDATADDHPSGATRRGNLSAALHDRYELIGAHRDLDDAIAAARSAFDAAAASADAAAFVASLLNNTSVLLRVRGELHDAGDDLAHAVELARLAVSHTASGHPQRPSRLTTLGQVLLSRHDRGHDGLDEAVEALEAAVADAPDAPGCRDALGLSLWKRFERDGTAEDLVLAVRHLAEAVRLYPEGHTSRAIAALNLGSAWRATYDRSGHDGDFAAAVTAWRTGASAAGSSAAIRMACARQWAELAAAAKHWTVAAEGYDVAVSLLPLVSWRGLVREDQEAHLLRQSTVARDAAAAAVARQNLEAGLGHLERGRALLWTQTLENGDEFAALREHSAELAGELERVRHALDALGSAGLNTLRRL